MNSAYCIHCTTKLYFGSNKPKFCSSCGKDLDAPPQSQSEGTKEVESNKEVPPYRKNFKPEVEIKINTARHITLADLIKSTPEDPSLLEAPEKRPPSNLPDGEDILRLTQSECSPTQAPKDIDG